MPAVTLILVMALVLAWPSSTVYGEDDEEDRASGAEWVTLVIDSLVAIVLLVVVTIECRRNANPHTGLPSKIKRRRSRGPLGGRR
jgi:TRAP-type C4-dicarboxylate transport system permease large subunit